MHTDLPYIPKNILNFPHFWPKSQYYNEVLQLCSVFLVKKKLILIFLWFYLLMGDDDLMMKS